MDSDQERMMALCENMIGKFFEQGEEYLLLVAICMAEAVRLNRREDLAKMSEIIQSYLEDNHLQHIVEEREDTEDEDDYGVLELKVIYD